MIRVLDSAGSTLVEWGRQQQQHDDDHDGDEDDDIGGGDDDDDNDHDGDDDDDDGDDDDDNDIVWDLWTDPVGVAALLDVWGEKLGGPRAGV